MNKQGQLCAIPFSFFPSLLFGKTTSWSSAESRNNKIHRIEVKIHVLNIMMDCVFGDDVSLTLHQLHTTPTFTCVVHLFYYYTQFIQHKFLFIFNFHQEFQNNWFLSLYTKFHQNHLNTFKHLFLFLLTL